MNRMIPRGALCLLAFVAIGVFPALSGAQSQPLLGGTLRWTATPFTNPCGMGLQFQATQFTNFSWQFGTITYPFSGSAAWISNSPGSPCPANGAQGGVGMNIFPDSAPFPVTCGFTWVPTSPSTGAIVAASEVQCGIFSNNTGPNPNTAIIFKNLQKLPTSAWTLCEGKCPSGGVNDGPPNNNGYLNTGIASPSMSGGSMEIQDVSTSSYSNFDVLFTSNGTEHLDWNFTVCAPGQTAPCTFSNYLDDLWFYVPSSSLNSLEKLEFDPDFTDFNHYVYKMSMECTSAQNLNTPNVWQFWDQATDSWVNTGQSCAYIWQHPNSWLHLQIYTTANTANHTYTYQKVGLSPENGTFTWYTWTVNGTSMTQYPISAYQPTPLWNPDIFVEQELDNGSGSHVGTSTVYYDQYSLIAW